MSADVHTGRLRFTKMHGAGNDFVVLDLRNGTPPPDASLAARLADRHFGVGCDQILTIETPRSAEAVAAHKRAGIPAGRFGEPDEFGAACAFLCSAQAGYITGQNLLIDGGAYPGTF